MKQFIRRNTFETNSSSTHSLTLNNHDKISDLIYEAANKVDGLNYSYEIHTILGLLKEAEYLLLKNLEEIE